MVCILLAHCSDRWRAFVNTVMDFPFLKMLEVADQVELLKKYSHASFDDGDAF